MGVKFRFATVKDIDALVEMENLCFETDNLSARNFKYFITKANSSLIVATVKEEVAGYSLLLFHKGTSLARLYSIAVHPNFRKLKIGLKLMKNLEEAAIEKGSTYIRLEVKTSNTRAIDLYEKLGYRKFAHKVDYYEDHTDAECYEKKIRKFDSKRKLKVAYYNQKTEFTCGPASLMMGMRTFSKKIKYDMETEMQIWREATTIFMTSGHGGCGPHGLALSAHRRGFGVELYLNTKASLFISGVRDKKKKDIIEVVQNQFLKAIKKTDINIFYDEYSLATIKEIIDAGGIPLVLISAYRLTENKAPHWIVITGVEDEFIYFHDPEIDDNQTPYDNMDIPVSRKEFEKMSKFGTGQLKSIVAIYKK